MLGTITWHIFVHGSKPREVSISLQKYFGTVLILQKWKVYGPESWTHSAGLYLTSIMTCSSKERFHTHLTESQSESVTGHFFLPWPALPYWAKLPWPALVLIQFLLPALSCPDGRAGRPAGRPDEFIDWLYVCQNLDELRQIVNI